jgi:hypothetical protein
VPPPPKRDAPRVEFVTRKTKKTFNAYIAYPKLDYDDPELSAALNGRIKRLVDQHERAFAELLRKEGLPAPDWKPRMFFAMTCSVAYASHSLASIGCDSYEFAGGAHGSKGYVALSLALPSLKDVRPSDVLVAGRKASATLVKLCNRALAKADGVDVEDALVGPDSEWPTHFDTFTIGHDGLTFYFKDQLPHAIADVVVPAVSWAALKPVLKKGLPAALVDPDDPFVAAETPFSPWDARGAEGG